MADYPMVVRAGDARPVSKAEFAALMADLGPFGPDRATHPVCLAVSGGGDSMALAVLARRWRSHVLALVVDHALRPESAEEAELTCQRLAGWGIPSRKLTLGRMRPGGVQQRAREARFAMLEAACVAAGGSVLLLAHHEADQEETLWMRQERGSGQRGLCGMAGRAMRGRIALLRPLLGIRPERLRATLEEAGLHWCEDPSNENRRFRRVAVRQDLTGTQREQMHHLHGQACAVQQEDEQRLARLMADCVAWHPEGWLELASQALHDGGTGGTEACGGLAPAAGSGDVVAASSRDDRVRDDLLGRLVRLVGGRDHAPARHSVAHLRQAGHGALGGACLRPLGGRKAGWMLYRETRNLPGRVPAGAGQLWDGRWRYLGAGRDDAEIGALGDQAASLRVGRAVPACILPSLPVLWAGGRVVAVPEGVRGLKPDLPRVPFAREAGSPVTGWRRWEGAPVARREV